MLRNFPLGKAPAVMLILLIISSAGLFFGTHEEETTITMWVFASTHLDEYLNRIPLFEAQHPNVKVKISCIAGSVYNGKLISAIIAGSGIPDLVEIEISSVGRFLRGTPDDIPFEDLTERLTKEGYLDKIVRTRFSPYTDRGRIYGIPHDIHPVGLLYRDDIFRACGVNMDSVVTWDDFVQAGLKVTKDKDGDGQTDQYAIMLAYTAWWYYGVMLLQHNGGPFGANDSVTIDNATAVETLRFFCDLFNKYKIAAPGFSNSVSNYAAFKEGFFLSVFCPDWYLGFIKKFIPELAGKWRLRPLPVWKGETRRTSTIGGTMLGLTKGSKHPDLVWELAKFLYLTSDAAVNRYRITRILPPLKESWSAPIFQEPDEYLGGQPSGRFFANLAPEIPEAHLNPYWAEVAAEFGPTLTAAVMGDKTPEQALRTLGNYARALIQKDKFVSK
jgi:arabinosaccharide transport system substrate-binding protein